MEKTDLSTLIQYMFQAHPWHGVAPGENSPDIVNTYIEIVPRDVVKYELDKLSGHLRIDRPQLFSSLSPTLYGFLPQSYCGTRVAEFTAERTGLENVVGDGDPLDICVLSEKAITSGNFLVNAKPIGGLRLIDHGEADDKIIAVLDKDLGFGHINDIADCPKTLIDRLVHYFLSYKQLPSDEKRAVQVSHIYGRDEAHEVIRRSIEDYREKFGNPESRINEFKKLLQQ